MKIIELKEIFKYFGSDLILKDVSFSIFKGEIIGFLGPNGAGKTTTMRILTGLLYPDQGEYYFNKGNILDNPEILKDRIGYLPENPPIYDNLRVIENLEFFLDIRLKIKNPIKQLNRVIDLCGLEEVRFKLASTLSKGYRQRLGLGIALLGDPEVIILDEPTVGLDPIQIKETRNLIKKLGNEKTVILSSHILSEVSDICNKVIIINNGEILTEEKPEVLVKQITANLYRIESDAEKERVVQEFQKLQEISEVQVVSGDKNIKTFIIKANTDKDLRKIIVKTFNEQDWTLISMVKEEPSLEEIFLNFVKFREDNE